jgi:hypothetical protein
VLPILVDNGLFEPVALGCGDPEPASLRHREAATVGCVQVLADGGALDCWRHGPIKPGDFRYWRKPGKLCAMDEGLLSDEERNQKRANAFGRS